VAELAANEERARAPSTPSAAASVSAFHAASLHGAEKDREQQLKEKAMLPMMPSPLLLGFSSFFSFFGQAVYFL
jgi:hypothetical protein